MIYNNRNCVKQVQFYKFLPKKNYFLDFIEFYRDLW